MGYVSGLEKYECVVVMEGGVVGGLRLESDLMYRLMRKRISMAKSRTSGESVWILMGL